MSGSVGSGHVPDTMSRRLGWLARGLTLTRIAALPLFAALIVRVAEGDPSKGPLVVLLYLILAGSDLVDGPLARRAGVANATWGRIDVTADVLFNLVSLTVAAALGLVGPWVPLSVLVLGGRFWIRILRARPQGDDVLPEDRLGKWAGVLFYLLVGAVVGTTVFGVPAPWLLARLGDLVSVYCLWVLLAPTLRCGARTQSVPARAVDFQKRSPKSHLRRSP